MHHGTFGTVSVKLQRARKRDHLADPSTTGNGVERYAAAVFGYADRLVWSPRLLVLGIAVELCIDVKIFLQQPGSHAPRYGKPALRVGRAGSEPLIRHQRIILVDAHGRVAQGLPAGRQFSGKHHDISGIRGIYRI